MKVYIQYSIILWAVIMAAIIPRVYAQSGSQNITREQQARLSSLMSQVCDVDGENQWRSALAEVGGANVEVYALDILVRGAPAEQKQFARVAAQRRFILLTKRIEKDTSKLFDHETAQRLNSINNDSYLAAAEQLSDLVYRENALRALRLFGTKDAIATIRTAAEVTPALKTLASETIKAIRAR